MKKKVKPTRKKLADALPLARYVVNGIEEIKGNGIACLSLKKISNSPCDYFVICEGTSRTHVQAIAGSVEDLVKKKTGSRPWHVEGLQNAEWVLMDYVDVVVHIFQPDFREHFALEDMWADAETKDLRKKAVVRKKAATKPAKKTTKRTVKKKPSVKAKPKKTVKKVVKKTTKKTIKKKATTKKKTTKKVLKKK